VGGSFFDLVYKVVRKIPKGRVATYGQVAALCGHPRNARAVGYALHVNPDPKQIPCHRVVNRFGGLSPAFAFGGEQRQKILLQDEGVDFHGLDTVDLAVYRWEEDYQ